VISWYVHDISFLILAELSASDCKSLCASKELAPCLDLVLGKVDLVHCVEITCPVRSLALWLCAQEQRNVRSLQTNKEEEKKLVDVAPH
jgi:hypothetical protein